MPSPFAMAVSQSSGCSVTAPIRTGWPLRASAPIQWSRKAPVAAGAAMNGSSSRSAKASVSCCASGWFAAIAMQRGSVSKGSR